MLLEFEKKVASFIEANGLFGLVDSTCSPQADKILLAVSGGADSTALLYAMFAIKAENGLSGDILCAHINHQLRGPESDGDEAFVVSQAEKLNLIVITKRLNVRGFARKNKLSIETAARDLRIASLLDIAQANDCEWVATAHQKDDNAETVIQRLVRGTGFRGLGGIWPVHKFANGISFVRPLLCVSRGEIVEYLRERNLKWREDRTNIDCTYRRNFIRHQLLPALQQHCTVSIVEQLSELSLSAQKFYSLVYSIAEKIWPQLANCAASKVTMDLKNFFVQHPAVKIEMVRRSLIYLGSGERDLTCQHYEKVLRLAQEKASGKQIELPDGFIIWCECGKLIFARARGILKPEEQISKSIRLEVPGRTRFGRYLVDASIFDSKVEEFEKFKARKNSFVEWFDLDKLSIPIIIRSRERGDRFVPLGLCEEKKVGKFLTAAKTPLEIRKKAFIVADAERIIWIWPIRIGERAKITSETKKIIQLQVAEAEIAD
jgi:tRNA(Ile)-lysidine synthase